MTPRGGWIGSPPPTYCARRAQSASARSSAPSRRVSRSATTAARAFDRTTTRPRSTTSGSSDPRPFHYEPETNGRVEKFIQTLKEQVLWIERFETLKQLRAAVRAFARSYNRDWLLERHG